MSRQSSNTGQTRAARRADRSGSGPTASDAPSDAPVARNPGARSWFGLLGEVLLVGVLVALVSLPIVTLPAALAAGTRHLARYARAQGSSLGLFWRDVRDALWGGVGVGVVAVVLGFLIAFDVALAQSGVVPGGWLAAGVGVVLGAVLVVGLLTAAGAWRPRTGWWFALRATPRRLVRDPVGALYLLATAAFAVVVTWQLIPLVVPALGCVALAVHAVPERPRRRP
ncbi:hypothetical protein ACDF64_09620 [Agromyces sp. MMS24-JH15]|uniref:hypothetical protein n=1 Tax=Agromyces sp. MMS24-JH15 TaxID=3243765 RepID=UPI003749F8A5